MQFQQINGHDDRIQPIRVELASWHLALQQLQHGPACLLQIVGQNDVLVAFQCVIQIVAGGVSAHKQQGHFIVGLRENLKREQIRIYDKELYKLKAADILPSSAGCDRCTPWRFEKTIWNHF